MPIKRAAYKQIRSDKKKRFKNISTVSKIKTAAKKLNTLVASGQKDKLKPALSNLMSLLHKASQKGVIPKKTASRNMSRVSKKVYNLLKAS